MNKNLRRKKRKNFKKNMGTAKRPRVSVFKSNKGIYAQLIDDVEGVTLASASTREIGKPGINIEIAEEVGKKLAENAKSAGIENVIFDRSGYPYHGRVRALANGARTGGLKF